jgi:multidrug efflux system membrane fusion protein
MNHEVVHPPEARIVSQAGSWEGRLGGARTWAQRRRRLVSILGALALLGVGLFYAFQPSPRIEFRGGRFNGNNGPMPVNVATVQKGDIPIVVTALGTVTPLDTVTVSPEVTGYITHILFKEGQVVHKGDVLAIIDPRPYQFALDQAQGQLVRDEAQLRDAEIDLQRYQNLLAQQSIASQQVDTQAALVSQDRGIVQTDKGAADNARLNLERTSIRSPITGRVGLRVVDEGNYIAAGDANGIVVVTEVQPISVIFMIPEDQLQAVMKQVHAGATLQVTARDRGNKTKLAVGKLSTIDNRIDTTTGTVKLRAEFDNADEALFPNQFVNVDLLVDTLKDATVVPVAAIQRGAPGTFVYLVDAEHKVSVRPVKLGPQTPENVSITEGLTPQDIVVTDGADRISDGAPVLLPGETPPAMPPTGNRPTNAQKRNGPPNGPPPGGPPLR